VKKRLEQPSETKLKRSDDARIIRQKFICTYFELVNLFYYYAILWL